ERNLQLEPGLTACLHASPAQRTIILSGQWCRYFQQAGRADTVHLVHVDVCPSPSWRWAGSEARGLCARGAREISLARRGEDGTRWTVMPVSDAPIAWAQRTDAIVVHGGGWALGTLEDAVVSLGRCPFEINLVAGSRRMTRSAQRRVNHYCTP